MREFHSTDPRTQRHQARHDQPDQWCRHCGTEIIKNVRQLQLTPTEEKHITYHKSNQCNECEDRGQDDPPFSFSADYSSSERILFG